MFCNYEKRSRFLPLILEFFLPGLGHLIMKKYLLGIIKIVLWLSMIILIYAGYQNHKSEKIEDNNKNIPSNEEQTKLINKKNVDKNITIQHKKDLNNKELEEYYGSSFEEDPDNNINLAKPYVANHIRIPIPLESQIITIIELLILACFFILYIFDLFAYGFAFYKDANGVPFL